MTSTGCRVVNGLGRSVSSKWELGEVCKGDRFRVRTYGVYNEVQCGVASGGESERKIRVETSCFVAGVEPLASHEHNK